MKKLVEYYRDNFGLSEENEDIRALEASNKLLWRLFITTSITTMLLLLKLMKGE